MMKTAFRRIGYVVLFFVAAATARDAQAAREQPVAAPAANTVPSLDVVWGPDEFESFSAYLATIVPADYPNLAGPSAAIFQKLIDSVEQDALEDLTLSVQDRIMISGRMHIALATTLMKYGLAVGDGMDYTTEVVHLLGGILVASRQMVSLLDELLPQLDPNAADYQARMDGLRQARDGMAQELDGVLIALQDTEGYSNSDRLILCRYFVDNGPAIFAAITETAQDDVIATLEGMIQQELDGAIRDMLEEFVAEANAGE